MSKVQCPVCGNANAEHTPSQQNRAEHFFECEQCGRFGTAGLEFTAADQPMLKVSEDELFKIRCLLAERAVKNLPPVVLTNISPGQDRAPEQTDLHDFMETFPKGPIEYFDRAILNFSRIVEHPTGTFAVSSKLFPLCFGKDFAESIGILDDLVDEGILRWMQARGSALRFTSRGWERVAKLQAPGGDSRQAFVAMWFDASRTKFFDEAYRPAIEDDKKTAARRVDRVEHNRKIDDEIIAEIRRSRYVVADFTGNRPGVYFEAGFALGLGLPVIWCVEQGHEGDLHFDTRQYNHITYTDPADLRTKLLNRIRATIV